MRPSSTPTSAARSASPATARPWPRFTTTSSCRSPAPAIASPRSAGASPILSIASGACRKACGFPKLRSIQKHSTSSPSTASSSRSSRRISARVSSPSQRRRHLLRQNHPPKTRRPRLSRFGSIRPTPPSTLRVPISSASRKAAPSMSSSTTALAPAPSPSKAC